MLKKIIVTLALATVVGAVAKLIAHRALNQLES